MARKIAIVGAGAVGGYAGAHMVRAGEDVTFIDPWPAHVEHMRQHGLRVTHAREVPEFSARVRALQPPPPSSSVRSGRSTSPSYA
jgi:2-dehydropantoate 2-reductase